MIGNDIIDLKAAAVQSNWKRARYLDKLYSQQEQNLILNAEDQDNTVWLLWAMKEAAYKAHQRRFQLPRAYNPKDLNCEINDQCSEPVSGMVKIGEYCYQTSASTGNDRLHCVASANPKKRILHKIFSGSADVKKELISTLSVLKNLSEEKISIVKGINAVPHLTYQNRPLNYYFSLSSHGNFSAFILMLRQY